MSQNTQTQNTQIFTGSVLHRPYPGMAPHWNAAQISNAAYALNRATLLAPELAQHVKTIVPGADIEDFWEPILRAAAAYEATRRSGVKLRYQPAALILPGDERQAQRLGPVNTGEENPYARDSLQRHPLLLQHAGREIFFATYYDNDEPWTDDLLYVLADMAERGHTRAFIKIDGRKIAVATIDISTDNAANRKALFDAFDYLMIRLADRPGVFIVQDYLSLQSEHRFFVVDGKVITHAGCIEEFTPIDRVSPTIDSEDPLDLNTPMRHWRQTKSALYTNPRITAKMLNAVITWLDMLAKDTGEKGTYVIDVALDASNNPVIIELNTLPNSGLYGSDVYALYAALLTAQDRGYSHYGYVNENMPL